MVAQAGERAIAPQTFWGAVSSARVPTFLTGVGTNTVTLVASAGAPVYVAFANGLDEGGPRVIVKKLVANLTVGGLHANAVNQVALQYDPTTDTVSLVLMPLLWMPTTEEYPQAGAGGIGAVLNAAHTSATSATGTASTTCSGGTAWMSFRGDNSFCYGGAPYINYWAAVGFGSPLAWDLIYDFGSAVQLGGFLYGVPTCRYPYSSPTAALAVWPQYYPTNLTLQGKALSGDAWTTVQAWTGQSISSGGTPGAQQPFASVPYALTTPATWRYWRLLMSGHTAVDQYLCLANVGLCGVSGAAGVDTYLRETNVLLDKAAAQAWRVFVGQVAVSAGGLITTVTPYCCGTRYLSDWTALAAAGTVTLSHNLGVRPGRCELRVRGAVDNVERYAVPCVTSDGTNRYGVTIDTVTPTALTLRAGLSGIWGDGTGQLLTTGYVRVLSERGW